MFARAHLGLAQGTVRYVGDPVALVVAETLARAKDAAELIVMASGVTPRLKEPSS
jgi:aerobic carbon-monoxide dehydrogenase large subunit